jgi:cytochrome c556
LSPQQTGHDFLVISDATVNLETSPESTMRQRIICALAALIAMLGISIAAIADTTSQDAADYRLAVMTSLKGHMVAASMIVRGLVEDNGYLAKHAQGMANSVGEIHRVFEEGSNIGESKALPAVWESAEKFSAAIAKAEEASAAFADVAAGGGGEAEAIGGAFRNVGMSCRGCHDDFRLSDD